MKRFWKAGVAAIVLLVMGGTAVGIVAAQSGSTPTPTPAKKQQLVDDFLSKLAGNLGISEDQLRQAITTTDQQMLDQAVKDGKITQDEANKIKDRVANGQLLPFFGRGFDHGRFWFKADVVAETASFLGISEQDVRDGLQNDQSLADIAKAHGTTADELSQYLYDQLKAQLDQAVTNGKITQDREDQMLSNAKDRFNQIITQAGPGKFGGWHDGKDMRPQGPPTGSPTETGSSL